MLRSELEARHLSKTELKDALVTCLQTHSLAKRMTFKTKMKNTKR